MLTHAVVTNILDLWAEPKYNSERVTQVLFGTRVSVGTRVGGFTHVSLSDGYSGWAEDQFLSSDTGASELSEPPLFVSEFHVQLMNYSERATPAFPYLLFYGTKIAPTSRPSKSQVTFMTPLGIKCALHPSGVRPIKRPAGGRKAIGKFLAEEALKFLGVPYLWGGVTTTGCDCSGFIQTLMSGVGIDLPRDTKDQIHCGKEVARDKVETGDLLFFERHVAMVTRRDWFIHSSRLAGGVGLNTFDKRIDRYRPDLDRDFKVAKRVL